jgi:hypothetical protein
MALDTKAPRPVVRAIRPSNVVGPVPGPVRIYLRHVSGAFPTRFAILRTDQGAPREVASFSAPPGARRAVWNGRVTGGVPAPPGVYLVQVKVRDRAGNVGVVPARVEPGTVPGTPGITVRTIAAQPPLRPVTAGGSAEFFVDARHHAYRWAVRRVGSAKVVEQGRAAANQARLSIRAPRGSSGMYLLGLRAGRRSTTVPFMVQSRTRSRVLVVVPAISWLGQDPIDDPPFDGVPNTLDDGGPVQWPRVLSGFPAGFKQQVEPLLEFLDRRHISYDLTSDIDLALSGNPRADDRPGVLLAGSERWVPRALAERLRRYVQDGGRVAEFGAGSLLRTVTLHASELVRPAQPSDVDAFGARLGPVRATQDAAPLSVIAGDTNYGLVTGIVSIPGFTTFEESAPAQPPAKLLVGLGQQVGGRPAITAVELGKGLVIRVGVPAWARGLGHPEVAQVTLNIFSLLRGATPKIETTSR